jgi:hypothetical protein
MCLGFFGNFASGAIYSPIMGSSESTRHPHKIIIVSTAAMHARLPFRANRFTSHCKKSSDLSRRQTTMKSATDLPNGDPQHLREMTLRSA